MQTTTNPIGTIPQIPHDLFSEILEHLEGDKSILRAVSLSSTVLRQEAQIILFRNVTTLPTESLHLKFLRTVAASPSRLAPLVRAYRIAQANISRDFSAGIHEGLQAMRNLNYLGVYYLGPTEMQSPDGPAAVLRGCMFKLERFQWMSSSSEAPELVETFLHGQDMLRSISIRFIRTAVLEGTRPIDSPIIICPQLVSLVGNWDVINALLPGHKIESLMVLDSHTRPSRVIDINSLAPALKHIKAFSHHFNYFRYDHGLPPERILPHCTSLTMLELGRLDTEKILSVLPKLPALHTLILFSDFLYDVPLRQEQATKLVQLVFDNSSINLQKIDIQIDTEAYDRYMRSQGDGAVSRVNRSEVRGSFPE